MERSVPLRKVGEWSVAKPDINATAGREIQNGHVSSFATEGPAITTNTEAAILKSCADAIRVACCSPSE